MTNSPQSPQTEWQPRLLPGEARAAVVLRAAEHHRVLGRMMIQTVHRQRLQSRVARDEDVARCRWDWSSRRRRRRTPARACSSRRARTRGSECRHAPSRRYRCSSCCTRAMSRTRARDRGAVDGTRTTRRPKGSSSRRGRCGSRCSDRPRSQGRRCPGSRSRRAEQISRMTGDLPPLAGARIESPYAAHRVVGPATSAYTTVGFVGTHRQADARRRSWPEIRFRRAPMCRRRWTKTRAR